MKMLCFAPVETIVGGFMLVCGLVRFFLSSGASNELVSAINESFFLCAAIAGVVILLIGYRKASKFTQ